MNHDSYDDTGEYDPERYDRPFAYNHASYQTQQQQPQQPIRRPAAAGRRPGSRRAKQQQQFNTEFNSFPQSAPIQQQAPAPQQAYQQPAPQQAYQQPAPQHHNVVNHQPAPAPVNNHHQYYQPQAPTVPPFNQAQLFNGHPARNFDINTGSYSVQYQG